MLIQSDSTPGTRLRYRNADGEVLTGTVVGTTRVENGSRTPVFAYVVAESEETVLRSQVVERRTPAQQERDLIEALLTKDVVDQIEQCQRDIERAKIRFSTVKRKKKPRYVVARAA